MKHLLTLGLAALLLSGCTSAPKHVDKGPIRAATFSFVVPPPQKDPFAPDRFAPVHKMIQDSITQTLSAKGLQRTSAGGDVIVAYLVIIGNNASTEAIDTYFGYGRNAMDLEDKAHAAYNRSKNPNYFEAGTLVVDIIDAKTDKVLKRSYVVRPLLGNVSAEVRAEHIQEAVNAVLNDVQISG